MQTQESILATIAQMAQAKTTSQAGKLLFQVAPYQLITSVLGGHPKSVDANFTKFAKYILERPSEFLNNPLWKAAEEFVRVRKEYNANRRPNASGVKRAPAINHTLHDAKSFLRQHFADVTPEIAFKDLLKTNPTKTKPNEPTKMILGYLVNNASLLKITGDVLQQLMIHYRNIKGISLEDHDRFIKSIVPPVPLQTAIQWHQNPQNPHCKTRLHPEIGTVFKSAGYWNVHVLLEYIAIVLGNAEAQTRFAQHFSRHHARNLKSLEKHFPLFEDIDLSDIIKVTDEDFIKRSNLNITDIKKWDDRHRQQKRKPARQTDITRCALSHRDRIRVSLSYLANVLDNEEAQSRLQLFKQNQSKLARAPVETHKSESLQSISDIPSPEAIKWFNESLESNTTFYHEGLMPRRIDKPVKPGSDLDVKLRYCYLINKPKPSDPVLLQEHEIKVALALEGLQKKLSVKRSYEEQRSESKKTKYVSN